MSKIKRGVSLYSYQQAQFFKILDVWQQIQEVREQCHTDGIEIISQQTIYGYPFPSDAWVSSDMTELLNNSTRVLIMSDGQIIGEGEAPTQEEIMSTILKFKSEAKKEK